MQMYTHFRLQPRTSKITIAHTKRAVTSSAPSWDSVSCWRHLERQCLSDRQRSAVGVVWVYAFYCSFSVMIVLHETSSTLYIEREITALYTSFQEIQEPWLLALSLGAKQCHGCEIPSTVASTTLRRKTWQNCGGRNDSVVRKNVSCMEGKGGIFGSIHGRRRCIQ